jgi:hypothetical protein
MTKDDRLRNQIRGTDHPNTAPEVFPDWDFQNPILPQVLRLFPPQDLRRLKQQLFEEVINDWCNPPDENEAHPTEESQATSTHWETAKVTSGSCGLRTEPQPLFASHIPLEMPPPPSYYTGDRPDFTSSYINDRLRLPANDLTQPPPMAHLDVYGTTARPTDNFYTNVKPTSSDNTSRVQNEDQRIDTPHLQRKSHPVLAAGPVHRGVQSSSTTFQYDVRFYFLQWANERRSLDPETLETRQQYQIRHSHLNPSDSNQ